MDALGALQLAARIRAGVRVGATIEVLDDASGSGQLRPGDRGVVRAISPEGVEVDFEKGFALQIDPDLTRYRAAA
jgi:hypothetical protein